MKIAVVTAIFGGFDKPHPLPEQNTEYDYFVFNEASGIPQRAEFTNRMKGKWYKYQQHQLLELQRYDIFIWLDGNFQIKRNDFVEYMVRQVRDYDMAMVTHQQRDCVYKEIDFILDAVTNPNADAFQAKYFKPRYGHEVDLLKLQARDYMAMGMPPNWGLFACGLFARKNIPLVNQAMDQAWLDNLRYCSQDQNPVPVALWKYNLKVNRLALDVLDNKFWHLNHHQQ